MKLVKKILSWSSAGETLNYYCMYEYMQNYLSFLSVILIATIILFPSPTFAGEEGNPAVTELQGFKFGIGLTLTLNYSGRNRVKEAEVVNGKVRVTEDKDTIPRLMLETHYFFVPKKTSFLGILDPGMWGWGPFVAMQSGTDEIVEAIGGGFMVGFRRKKGSPQSFNLGLGAVVDPSVRVLGDGLSKNDPLPEGETQVRYKHTNQWGVLLITSYSF